MNKYPLILFCTVLLIGIATFSTCQDTYVPLSQSEQKFPNSIGNSWTYAVYDSTEQDAFTVQVSIVGETTLSNGEPATIWQYTWPDRVDTQYVQKLDNQIRTYKETDVAHTYTTILLDFPLEEGKKFGRSEAADTSDIVLEDSVTTPAGSFERGFKINRSRSSFNYWLIEHFWFVPHVGIVKMHRKEYPFGPVTNRTWILLEYELQEE